MLINNHNFSEKNKEFFLKKSKHISSVKLRLNPVNFFLNKNIQK